MSENFKNTIPQQEGKEQLKKYKVTQIDQWTDGKSTETVLGENLTKEATEKIDHGAISNPDDSRVETTTRVEEM